MKQDSTTIRVVKIVALLAVMLAMGRTIVPPSTTMPTHNNACPACGGPGK